MAAPNPEIVPGSESGGVGLPGGVTGGGAAGWSDRFEEGLHPAIERFNASIGFDIELLQQDLDGSIAHATMLGSVGVITTAEAQQLVAGLEQVRQEAAAGDFRPGLEAEDVHFAVERRLIELLGPVGKTLHTGRSRNDQVGTDLRLWLRQKVDRIDGSLLRFERALLAQAEAQAIIDAAKQHDAVLVIGPSPPVGKDSHRLDQQAAGPGQGLEEGACWLAALVGAAAAVCPL